MPILHISVIEKIASYQKRDGDIVCGNSDYLIEFTFDDEWEDYPTKTARFIWNGKYYDSEFTGNSCAVPIIKDAEMLEVGVFAGDLQTTTRAQIDCRSSILCGNTVPVDDEEADAEYASAAKEYASQASKSASDAAKSASEAKSAANSLVIPSALPNPHALTINGTAYNGSKAVNITVQGGGGGMPGEDGATFTPSVSSSGVISWTNDKGLANPAPVNIKGGAGTSAYQSAVNGGYTGSEVEFEQKMAREIPVVTQTTGNSDTLVMSQGAVSELFDSINELPYGGSKEWLEKNGDITKLYQIDGYVWGYIESDGWTKSGTQFILVSSWMDVVNAGGTPYAYRTPGSNECTVLEYHEASGDIGIPVYSEKPITANEGDIIAVGGRKYRASITSKQEPAYTDFADHTSADWLSNKRLDSSGNTKDESGSMVTNYIPCVLNDNIRVKGLGKSLRNTNKVAWYYDTSKKPIGCWYPYNDNYYNETYDSATDTSVIKAGNYYDGSKNATYENAAYVRFTITSGTPSDIIITVNEEITNRTVTTVTWTDIGEYIPPVEAGWSETDETHSVIDSLSTSANSGDTAVYSADGYLYTYIAGSDWMATSKYIPRQLDNSLSETSSNAVQNKVVTAAINEVKYTANKNANEILSLRNDVEALGTPSSDVVTIPSYWESMVANKTATVKELQKVGGKNCVSFAYASDTHIPDNDNGRTNDIGKVMAKMLDNCEIPFAVITGDVATRASYPTEEEYVATLSQVEDHLAPLWGSDRLLPALGNHDGCYGDSSGYYRKQFSPDRMWQEYFRSHALDFRRVFSEDGLYYYVDNIPQKMRYIILNSQYAGEYSQRENGFAVNNRFATSCYGQEQLDWLCEKALDMPEGYGAIIATHVPLNVEYTVDKAQIIGIINAYNGKKSFTGNYTGGVSGWSNSSVNVNFSSAKGEVIAVFAGHVHGDSIDGTSLSCPLFTILSAGASANEPYKETAPTRTKGTDTETSFDIVTINRKTRTIYCTRVGAGSDRSVIY